MYDLEGKTYVVTGGTSGIGLATATALAARGARVAILGRNRERCDVARRAILTSTGREVIVVRADLGRLRDVDRAAGELSALGRIDALVNNAGVWRTDRRISEDGYEETFAVNVLGPFRLTSALVPSLAHGGRIVNVASYLYRHGRLDVESAARGERFHPLFSYCDSHLGIVLWTRVLAAKLAAQDTTVNVVHPGTIRSNLSAGAGGALGCLYRAGELFADPPEKGATAPVYLATAPELRAVTGAYFVKCARRALRGRADDRRAAERLWSLCESAAPAAYRGGSSSPNAV